MDELFNPLVRKIFKYIGLYKEIFEKINLKQIDFLEKIYHNIEIDNNSFGKKLSFFADNRKIYVGKITQNNFFLKRKYDIELSKEAGYADIRGTFVEDKTGIIVNAEIMPTKPSIFLIPVVIIVICLVIAFLEHFMKNKNDILIGISLFFASQSTIAIVILYIITKINLGKAEKEFYKYLLV